MLVLHGALGSAANFRPVARRLAKARPDWGFVLADLRGHGKSGSAPPPHTLAAAAADFDGQGGVRGVMGHSLGGKVALAYAAGHPDLAKVLVLDSNPGARAPDTSRWSALGVAALLEEMTPPFASRAAFVDAVTARLDRRTADWLAMSLRPSDDGYRLVYDLPAIRALMADYFASDLWSVVEDPARASVVELVVGGKSDSVPPEDRARAERSVRVHVLERAAHWVHADDPEGLHAVLESALPEASA
jgi:pimeloyl-ACP methyl ester carboxylesterase